MSEEQRNGLTERGPTGLSIGEAGRELRAMRLSSTELTDAYLSRIERFNEGINAFVTVCADGAREAATRADIQLRDGEYLGPLHGIPIALKDVYQTAGVRTTAGSRALANWVPTADCTVTRKLKQAGAVLLGMTNAHEFGWGVTTNNPLFGQTRNPWDASRVPGGSSGGSAAAVAGCLAAGAMGTDAGGSVRIPAALCGVVGLKPSYGRISSAGVIPMSPFFDHPGPIARTTEDAALLLQAVAGYDAEDPATVPMPIDDYTSRLGDSVSGVRFGIPRNFVTLLQPDIAELFDRSLAVLLTLGAELVELDLPLDDSTFRMAYAVASAEAQAYFQGLEGRDLCGEDVQRVLETELPDAVGLVRSAEANRHLSVLARRALETVDLIVCPTTRAVAPVIGESAVRITADIEVPVNNALAMLTWMFNSTRLPAISVPCGLTTSGLPVGLQLAGKPFDESLVFQAAAAFEKAAGWDRKLPALELAFG